MIPNNNIAIYPSVPSYRTRSTLKWAPNAGVGWYTLKFGPLKNRANKMLNTPQKHDFQVYKYYDLCLLELKDLQSGYWLLAFWKKLLPPSTQQNACKHSRGQQFRHTFKFKIKATSQLKNWNVPESDESQNCFKYVPKLFYFKKTKIMTRVKIRIQSHSYFW